MKSLLFFIISFTWVFTIHAQNHTELTIKSFCGLNTVDGKVVVKLENKSFEKDLSAGEAYFLLKEDVSTKHTWAQLPYQLNIYPNPALNGQVYIEVPTNQALRIELFDLRGQKLGQFNSNQSSFLINNAPSMVLIRMWHKENLVQQGKLLSAQKSLLIQLDYNQDITWETLKSNLATDEYEIEIFNFNDDLIYQETRNIIDGTHDTATYNLCKPDTTYLNSGGQAGSAIMLHDGSGKLDGSGEWAWLGGGNNSDRHLYMYFNDLFLVNQGDQIILTVNYIAGLGVTGLNEDNQTPLAFRVGLFNNNGTEVANNSGLQNPGFSNYEGYYTGYSVQSENGISIFEREIGHNNLILGDQDVALNSGTADSDMNADENRTFQLIIEKTSIGNKITMKQNGSGSFDYDVQDNADVESVFNTIALGFDDTPELLDWYYINYIHVQKIANDVEPIFPLNVMRGSGSGNYKELTGVTIIAEDAHEDSVFSHWIGDTVYLEDPTEKSASFNMPDAALNFTATYKEKGAFTSWPLFIYDFGGLEELSVQERVDLVYNSGYQGLAVRVTSDALLDSLDVYLDITSTMSDFEVTKVFFRYNFNASDTDRNRWRELMERIKGTGIDLWFIFGRPQSGVTDETIRTVLREVVDSAEVHQVPVTLYPHHLDVIETAEEALPFVQEINSPYLDLAVHSCHEIRSGNGGRIEEVIDNVIDYMGDVTIAGSDSIVDFTTAFTTERSTIMPLDEGTYDITRILRKLKEIGYDKEVGFINHIIPESVQTYVPRSYATWEDMLIEINE